VLAERGMVRRAQPEQTVARLVALMPKEPQTQILVAAEVLVRAALAARG
jgi:hypothetical protein